MLFILFNFSEAWARFFSNSPARCDNPRIPGGETCKSSDTKMPEGLDSLTFPMPRESESASRLRAIVSDMLPLFSNDYSDDDVLTVRYLFSPSSCLCSSSSVDDSYSFYFRNPWFTRRSNIQFNLRRLSCLCRFRAMDFVLVPMFFFSP